MKMLKSNRKLENAINCNFFLKDNGKNVATTEAEGKCG